MSQTNDLQPPIDTNETETIGFDFGPILGAGVTVSSIAALTCSVHAGADQSPMARLLGSPSIIASAKTSAANAAVSQQIGTMLAGVTYTIDCLVNTSDGQKLGLWTRISCVAPI